MEPFTASGSSSARGAAAAQACATALAACAWLVLSRPALAAECRRRRRSAEGLGSGSAPARRLKSSMVAGGGLETPVVWPGRGPGGKGKKGGRASDLYGVNPRAGNSDGAPLVAACPCLKHSGFSARRARELRPGIENGAKARAESPVFAGCKPRLREALLKSAW